MRNRIYPKCCECGDDVDVPQVTGIRVICEECYEETLAEFGNVERDGRIVTIYEVEGAHEMEDLDDIEDELFEEGTELPN